MICFRHVENPGQGYALFEPLINSRHKIDMRRGDSFIAGGAVSVRIFAD